MIRETDKRGHLETVAGRRRAGVKNADIAMVKFGKHEKIKTVRDLQFAEDGGKMVPQGLFANAQAFELFFCLRRRPGSRTRP